MNIIDRKFAALVRRSRGSTRRNCITGSAGALIKYRLQPKGVA